MTSLELPDRAALLAARLHSQQIDPQRFATPGEVVAALGTVQAQDYQHALWAIALRLRPSPTTASRPPTTQIVEQAIADRAIVRSWPMRGTLHFTAAADLGWMLRLLTPRMAGAGEHRRRQLGIEDATIDLARALLIDALQGGRQLTRPALFALLESAGIPTAGQRGYHMLWKFAHEELICLGVVQGNQPTFTLLDEWIPHRPQLGRDEALAELVRRYFTGHGPATVKDFATWSGLTLGDARIGLAAVRAETPPALVEVTLDGTPYWMAASILDAVTTGPLSHLNAASSVHLLPGFDEYLLGYQDRNAMLDPEHVAKITPGRNGVFRPMLVIDGRVVGTWQRTRKPRAVHVTVIPFAPLQPAVQEACLAAAARYGESLGLPVEVMVTTN